MHYTVAMKVLGQTSDWDEEKQASSVTASFPHIQLRRAESRLAPYHSHPAVLAVVQLNRKLMSLDLLPPQKQNTFILAE